MNWDPGGALAGDEKHNYMLTQRLSEKDRRRQRIAAKAQHKRRKPGKPRREWR